MINELQKNNMINLAQFIQNFPYDEYLKKVPFTDFNTLQSDRLLLWKNKGEGDIFLYHLGQKFIELYPVSYDDLEKKVDIGEAYINPMKSKWNKNTDEIYQIIGYYILGKVSSKIEEGIQSKNLKQNSKRILNIVQRLEANKIYLPIEKSNSKKIIEKIISGEYKYIIERGKLKLLEIFSNKEKVISQYQTKIKLNYVDSYLKINNNKDNAINIFTIEENGKMLGHCIWLERPYVDATYLAFQNVQDKFNILKNNKKLVLATTGGYTNANQQPEGLTIENGNIVNATIMHDRHGLVLVEKNGGIRILNLKNSEFLLPYGGPKIDNPLDNLIAFSDLLNWAKRKQATLFQTHLLAFSDSILISPLKAKSQLRERRILALCSDPKTNRVYHIIFDITSPYDLSEITFEIFAILKKRDKKIEGLLNLDVGSYNILQVYDNNGNVIISAPVNIVDATNLLIYSVN